MIRKISVKNFALINELSIEFDKGFSIFTGETGAGKSILIEAIGILLGERASSELIRSGYNETEINGIFELDTVSEPLSQQISKAGITLEDNTLIIRRIILKNGKKRIYINQTPIPLSTLKAIGNYLVDLHGQHEHQSLLRQETANLLINSLPEVTSIWGKYYNSYNNFIAAKTNLNNFDKQVADLKQKHDLIEFQYNELANMKLAPDEENTLKEEFTMLSSITERLQCIANINSIIEDAEGDQPLERQIITIRKNLETLQKFDSSARPWIDDIENFLTLLSELEAFCSSYSSHTGTTANPARLEHINSRLAKIQRLKRKYNCSFDDLIKKQKEFKEQLFSIENIEADRSLLEEKAEQTEKICRENAETLSKTRKKATQKFDKIITKQMENLGFSGGKWKTAFISESEPTTNGLESIVFEVRTNVGEPFLPLIKIASGGEISRLMLAIKTVLTEQDNIPILIFDEIDAGIGGLLAKKVAKSLYSLSKSHQVICISHLHQIASVADHHYRVYKTFEDNRTITKVQILNDKEKVGEISRMLGSDSTISKKHAQELLAQKSNK